MDFDTGGNLFVANMDGLLAGIDPLDGIFFNGNDNVVMYPVFRAPTAITFDSEGNGYYFDAEGAGNIYKVSSVLPPIPEPASLLLGSLASIGLMLRRRCLAT